MLAAATGLVAEQAVFRNPPAFRVPQGAIRATAHGDFNGDGHRDILLGMDDRMVVMPGDGAGSFGAPIVSPFRCVRLAIADFNRDGHLDTACSGNLVEVMLGTGTGTFAPPLTLLPAPWIPYLTTGDYNADGNPDLVAVTSNHTSNDPITAWLGKGDGTFHPAVVTLFFDFTRGLTSLDVDGDGRSDLVWDTGGKARILRSNGDGKFTYINFVEGRAGADFDGDGKLDLTDGAVVNYGRGDGTFDPLVPITPPVVHQNDADVLPSRVVVADMNVDGKPDVVVTEGTSLVWIALGGGNTRTFQRWRAFIPGDGALSLHVADFDGDQKPDVVTHDANSLVFVHGNGDGTLRAYESFGIEKLDLLADTRFGDVTGDGKVDAVHLATQRDSQLEKIITKPGGGDGTFGAAVATQTTIFTLALNGFALGHLNADGKLDAVVVGDGALHAFLGQGDGTFTTRPKMSVQNVGSAHIADFTGEGRADVLIATHFEVSVYPGDGAGNVGPRIATTIDDAALFGDVNGDGRADVISGSALDDRWDVWLAQSNGTFVKGSGATTDDLDPFALVDLNRDTRLDLVLQNTRGLRIRLGVGDGTFGPETRYVVDIPGSSSPVKRAIADFNGDASPDLIVDSMVLLGDGSGRFHSLLRPRQPGMPDYPAGRDVDGNGSADLLGVTTGTVPVFRTKIVPLGATPATLTMTMTPPAPTDYGEPVAIGVAFMSASRRRPTAGVTILVDGLPAGGSLLDADDKGTLRLGFEVGTHTVTARYPGDDFYGPATATTTVTIARAAAGITANTPLTAGVGSPVLVSAFVFAAKGVGELEKPTGQITIRDGALLLGVISTASTGFATISLPLPGQRTVTFEYSGDSNHLPSTTTRQVTVTGVAVVPTLPPTALLLVAAILAGVALLELR